MKAAGPLLRIVGCGAVSPAGCAVEALWEAHPGEPGTEALLSQPDARAAVRRVEANPSALLRWQSEPRLRRAGRLTYYLMEAAHQALENPPDIPRDRLGLVCALGTGNITYSRGFFGNTLKKGRRFASPVLFPETVYNAPVSHVAALLGISGACYTLVGDETTWVDALRVAQVWLRRGTADAVLVLAGEELDAVVVEAFYRAGWTRRGLIPTEGAAAILVCEAKAGEEGVIEVSSSSIAFRSRAEELRAWEQVVQTSDLPLVLPANLAPSTRPREIPAVTEAFRLSPDWGCAFAASAGWSFLQAAEHRRAAPAFRLLVPGANTAVTSLSFL